MINIGKEFFNIAFQNPNRPSVIERNNQTIVSKPTHGPMGTFMATAGKRVKNEFLIKIRIQNSVNGMVEKTVSDTGFVNFSGLRIIYFEGMIRTMAICFIHQLLMKH